MLFWISLAVVIAVGAYFLLPKKKAKTVHTPLNLSEPEPPVEIDPEAAKPDEYIPPEQVPATKAVKKKK